MDNTQQVPEFAELTDNPRNLWEYLWYVKAYEADIYVRELVEEKWDSVALSELRPDRWAYHVSNWAKNGVIPARIRKPSLEETDAKTIPT